MPALIQDRAVMLISAEKDALQLALIHTPESREKLSLHNAIERSGMHDGEVCITATQNQFIQCEIPPVMRGNSIKGSKLDSETGRQVIGALLLRINQSFQEN